MTVLELKNVSKRFGGAATVTAVDNVSFQVQQGAFLALVGTSGSGKTTLLNLSCGLDAPSSGQIFIDGQDITTLTQKELCLLRQKTTSIIFQSYNLFPVLKAVENVEFTCLIRGENRKVARAKAQRALDLVGLSAYAQSFPNQLSGGQQQRVAVARALATEPKIIFADEPTANLDSKTAQSLIDLFEELNQKSKITFVFSTHDLTLVSRVREKLTLKDGKLI